MASEIKNLKENDDDLRIAPMNIEAEQAILASLLSRNSAYERISDFLKPIKESYRLSLNKQH